MCKLYFVIGFLMAFPRLATLSNISGSSKAASKPVWSFYSSWKHKKSITRYIIYVLCHKTITISKWINVGASRRHQPQTSLIHPSPAASARRLNAHHRTSRPKREKENLKRNTPIGAQVPPRTARRRAANGGAPRPARPERARASLAAVTTKSPTTGLVSGCVPSAPHHVPHASTRCACAPNTIFVI